MPDLKLAPLSVDDAPLLLAFEVANRLWFEQRVGPRPDSYWKLDTLTQVVREQVEAGEMMYLLKRGGRIMGRVNLTALDGGVAQLGYRIGQAHTGQGVATLAVAMACDEARDCGVWALEARVALKNLASKRVLQKSGFICTGHTVIGDLECETFRRDLDHD
ncbi:GNAT family N-acetyltransferase [uncultured Aliiroseovarius sp.]|uniref:GNAT family N-acetyltransferase n=1 Tax=uncultured Aliiroseovarius sp. TaxID=1658783 RepID=UPI0025956D2A|nr:GNAT family N-acetyltransferase [uncultured Aliiroseovarius sp.]